MFIEQKLNYLIDAVNDLARKMDAMQNVDIDNPIDINEASKITGYYMHTIRKYKDEIGYTQMGRKLFFTANDIEKWRHNFTQSPKKINL